MTRSTGVAAAAIFASASLVSVSQTLAARPGGVSLKAVNLQKSDLPVGFQTYMAMVLSTSASAHAAVSSLPSADPLQHHGYVRGFEAGFSDKKRKAVILSLTFLFRSVKDATWAYDYEQKREPATSGASTRVPTAAVGNASSTYRFVQQGSGPNIEAGSAGYGLNFRRSAFVASIVVFGLGRSYGRVSQVVALAKVVDKRIQATK